MTLAILQARMSSSRLPGKVLLPIHGRPMIMRQIERIRRAATLEGLVVATSVDPSDDPLADLLGAEGVTVRRGPLDDVLARFLEVIDEFGPDDVVRLTADNPMTDPQVIDLVVSAHREAGADYTANTLSHTFPHGLDVEVVAASALRALADLGPDEDDREHVTVGLPRRPGRFRSHSVAQDDDQSELRWTVDYPEDLAWARQVYDRLYPGTPAFGQADVLALIEREPALRRTVADAPS